MILIDLIFRKKILRNVQEQLDHFEIYLVNYVSSVQFQHAKVVYLDKVNYFVNGNLLYLVCNYLFLPFQNYRHHLEHESKQSEKNDIQPATTNGSVNEENSKT